MTNATPTILEAIQDPRLLPGFADSSWAPWKAALAALFGLPMTQDQLDIYRAHTGRDEFPTMPASEGWFIVGRRGGKSRMAALVAVYLAAFRDYSEILSPGERGVLMVLAADRKQARVIFRYCEALLDSSPVLAPLVTGCTKETLSLSNGVDIEIHTASYRSTRGYTCVGAILDEVAFWQSDESSNPDKEIISALRPAMATVPSSILLAISSPYSRRGQLWENYKNHYGKVGPILTWNAPSREMNSTIPNSIIQDALEADEPAARAEWLAEFRKDVESYVSIEAIEAVTVPGRHQIPPLERITYKAFVDPSGGSSDSMTLAIAHREDGKAVLDLVLERRPPFSPESVVEEFAQTLRQYRVSKVYGDRYGGVWPSAEFTKRNILYEPSQETKSEIYGNLLPVLNSGKVELLDNKRLQTQIVGLERRTSRSGRDSIDHGPHGHDDLINSAAGALLLASKASPVGFPIGIGSVYRPDFTNR